MLPLRIAGHHLVIVRFADGGIEAGRRGDLGRLVGRQVVDVQGVGLRVGAAPVVVHLHGDGDVAHALREPGDGAGVGVDGHAHRAVRLQQRERQRRVLVGIGGPNRVAVGAHRRGIHRRAEPLVRPGDEEEPPREQR